MPKFAAIILLGSLLAFYGNQLPDRIWSAYVPILLLLFRFNPAFRLPLLLAAAWLWSAAILHYHLDHRLIAAFDNRDSLVRGIIADLPEIEHGRVRLYLEAVEIAGYPGRTPRLLHLNWYQDEIVPQAGEFWQFDSRLRQPRGLMNPNAFDFAKWQFSRGIDARGYIRDSRLNRQLAPAAPARVGYWRTRLAAAIDEYCRDCRHRGLIKALALGFRGDIGRRDEKLLRDSATAHLLAISGMHIGLVAGLAFAGGRFYWRMGPRPRWLNRMECGLLFALLAALVYAALAGFSLPTVRALVMLVIVVIALLSRQRINLLQSLSLALAFILLCDPRAVGSSSFWLSFGALLVIACAAFRLPDKTGWWRQLLLLQIFFSLLFAPVGALVFGQFSPAGFPANIVAIPVVSFVILPLVLLACLLASLGALFSTPLLWLADRVLRHLLEYLEWLLSPGLEPLANVYPPLLLLLLLGLALVLLLPRDISVAAVAAVAIGLLLTRQPPRPAQGEFEMVVFDVGMGTSVLLQTRHHSLVFDVGPGRPGQYSAVDWGLMPELRKRGIGHPDMLIVSHVDQDHSGGLHRLLERDSAALLLSGTPRALQQRFALPDTPRSCHDYPAWRWDGVDFSFLALAGRWRDTNNRSCVLLVSGYQRVLLPGDIEQLREQQLVNVYAQGLNADLLLVPHHGSATSSSREFIQQVAPRYAVMTLSRGNRWGFPADGVSQRYADAGSEIYRSDRDGAVSLKSSRAGLSLSAAGRVPKRIWRRW